MGMSSHVHRRHKGILDMVDLNIVTLPHHSDDIEPNAEGDTHPLHIGVGSKDKVAHLSPVHCLFWFGHLRTVTGLHLYNDKCLSILRDSCDVEVAPACTPIAVQDTVAFSLKVFGGFLLAPPSVIIVGSHDGGWRFEV